MRHHRRFGAAACLLGTLAGGAQALDMSFRGTFAHDDDVRFIDFAIDALSEVIIRTYSYAGGVNAAGETIPRGGFDPSLALFHGSGGIVTGADNSPATDEDPLTYRRFDALMEVELGPGEYRLAVTQYDNVALGPRWDSPFTRSGMGDFTPTLTFCEADRFCDVTGVLPWNARTGDWAVDVLNVRTASLVPAPPPVPEPRTGILTVAGLACVAAAAGRRRRDSATGI